MMNTRKLKRKHVIKWLNVALICMLTAAISGVGTTLCALADVQKHTDEEAYFKAELIWNNDYSGDTAPVYSTEHSIVPVQNRSVSVKARNDGDEDMFVRMYLTTKWVALEAVQTSSTDSTIKEYKKVKEISSSDATTVSNGSKFKQSLISLTKSSESDSKWVYDDEDGCYYYNTGAQPILPDEETGNLVTTVNIDKTVGDEYNDNTHHDESTELNKYVEYGAGDGGTDKVYYAGVEVYVTLQAVSIPIPHTVKFVTNNGQTIPDQTIKHNRFAKDPNDLYPELMTNPGKVFAGWYTKSNFATDSKFNLISTQITSDVTLYAKWVDAPYDINLTFDANGGTYSGTNPQTKRVELNSNGAKFTDSHDTAAGDPTKDDYVFMGWYTSNGDTGADPIGDGWGQRFNFNQSYYQDQKVYAKWAPVTDVVRVTYVTDTNGDGTLTSSTVRTEYVNVGELATKPDDPIMLGYNFKGWFTKDGSESGIWGTEFNFDTTTLKQDITLYAKWEESAVEHTVTFDTNDGSPLITSQKVKEYRFATQPADPFLAGKKFAGWYTDEGTWKNNWNFNVNKVTEDVTLHARWVDLNDETVEHKVYFNSKGGSPTPATQTVKAGEWATEPSGAEIPTKEGFIFGGWWQDENNAFSWGPISNDSLAYAKWIEIADPSNPPTTIQVTYDSNGGSNVGTQTIEKGTTPPQPTNPIRVGYNFIGWFKDNGQEYRFDETLYENTNLTAKWEEVSDDPAITTYHKVTFDSKDGTAVPEQKVKDGWCAVEPNPAPTKVGYVFVGWYYDENYTNEYCFSTKVVSDVKLYAKWATAKDAAKINHKVWFDGNEGDPAVQLQNVQNGAFVDATQVQTPSRDGYTFAGWWLNDHDAFSWESPIIQETYSKAHWVKNDEEHPEGWTTVNVTFHSNGGSKVGTQTIIEGEKAVEPTTPLREGYTFEGWYSDLELTQIWDFEDAVEENLDLYASWSENANRQELTVAFNSQGGSEVAPQTVLKGDLAKRPADPTKDEKTTFAGWYADSSCTIQFDFSTPIVQNTTLYAKWESSTLPDSKKTDLTVTFLGEGGKFADGNQVKVETVKNGSFVSRFDAPTKEGYTFAGWWLDNNNAFDFSMVITNNLTVVAHWEKNDPEPVETHLVEFIENGGTTVGDQTIADGKLAKRPDDPTRNEYAFVNWYADEGCTEEFDFDVPITADTKVYAKWKANVEYTVSFDTNYGVPQIADQKVGKGEYAKEPVNPVRSGKQFVGWYSDNNTFLNKWNFGSNAVTEDITLYAKWVDIDQTDTVTHKVSFDSRGGSVTPATQTVKDGEYATEPTGDEIPTKDGYIFRGWWKDNNNAFVWGPIHNDETAYAKWVKVNDPDNPPTTITVTYDSNGGSPVGTQVIQKGTTPPRPDDPMMIGYKFLGWFDASGVEYDFRTALDTNTTFTAHWEKLSDDPEVTAYHNVTFDSKDGSAVDAQSVKHGDCAVEPYPEPTKEGFVFIGWYYDEACTEEVCFSTPITADLTLYACWKTKNEADETSHKVWFMGNGGQPDVQRQDVTNGGYIDASQIQTPEREGYTFNGWWYDDNNAFALDKAITQETTVTAHWKQNDAAHPDGYTKYTVTYHSNGGSAVGPQSVVAGEKAPQPSDPVKIGYTFDGWFSDEGLTAEYNFNTAVNANIDLYAKWTPVADRETLTVKFDTQGGNEIADQSILKGDLATRPADPVKEGDFVFAGWFSDKACTIQFDFAKPITQSLTIYAKWENKDASDKDKTTFTVTFKTDGGSFADGNHVKVETVKNGETVTRFDNPTKEGWTFTGWWLDSNNAYDFLMPITNDITVTAHWTKNDTDPLTTYVVEFVENGGSPVGDQTVVAGETPVRPDDPTRNGYTFVNWYSDEGLTAEFDFSAPITKNVRAYAKWEADVEYTVSFDTNYGVPQIADQKVGKGEYAKEPVTPIRSGKQFVGWYTDNNTFLNKWNFGENAVTEDITLYAKWVDIDQTDIVTHQVSFDSRGGSVTPATQTVKDGEYATEPTGDEVPTKEGYVFKGWWADNNNAFVWGPIHNDVTAYAKWVKVIDPDNPPTTITVTYDSAGGSEVGAQVIESGTIPPKPDDPQKIGYEFKGWFKADETQYNFDVALTENTTLTAHWEKLSDDPDVTKYYTFAFNSRGGTAVASQSVKEGDCAVEPEPAPTMQGYVFVGWFYDTTYLNEVSFSTPVTNDVTVYAKWESAKDADSKIHKVWFDADGGTPEIQKQEVANGAYIDASKVQTPTKEGYTFVGWWYDESNALAWDKAITQETYVKAHWEKKDSTHPDEYDTYTVVFHENGGTKVGSQSVVAGKTATKPTDPIREGYDFQGWYVDEGLQSVYDFGLAVNDNLDLYAKWELNADTDQFTVRFDSQGGSSVPSQTVTKNNCATRPTDPTKDGQVFAGWYLDKNCTIAFDFATPVLKPLILYAKWENENTPDKDKTEFTVTFKGEGGKFSDGNFVKTFTVKNGSTVPEFDNPTRDGYAFNGWWLDDNNGYDFTVPITKDTTIYAHWSKNDPDPVTTFLVEFIENGGSAVGDQVIISGQTAKRPNDPTKKGYVFLDWYSDEECTQAYDFDTPVTDNMKIYAGWEEKVEYTVSFDTNMGSPLIPDQTVQKNKLATEPIEPTRAGKNFAGWYLDEDTWAEKWDFNTSTVTDNITLHARWIDIDDETTTFQVTFDAAEGSPTPATQTVKDGEYATEPTGSEVPTRAGYTFGGWWETDDTAFAWGPIHSDKTAIAHWIAGEDKETVHVTFNYNGGGKDRVATIAKGSYVTKPAVDPAKAGYKFLGWYTDAGTEYTFDEVVNEDLNLTAQFEEISDKDAKWYNVIFDSQGGSDVEAQKVKEGQCAVEPVPAPTKENMVFAGWFYDENLTEEVVFSNVVTQDLTLYAAWKTKDESEYTSHKVWFDGNGGTPSSQSQEVKNEGYVDMNQIETPTRDGYTFTGWWYTDKDAFAPEKQITQETYVSAHWKQNDADHPDGWKTYVVTYHPNGGSAVGPQSVEEGGLAPEPTSPVKAGYTFSGWYTDEGLANKYNFSTPVTENIDLYAKWTANSGRVKVTVSFETYGGTEVSSQTVLKGEKIKRPADPTRGEDEAFAGWFTDDACTIPFDFGNAVTSTMILYAKWESADMPDDGKTQFQVTFKTDGGQFADGNQVRVETVPNGGTVTSFDNPTKEGYTFTGWWIDSNNAYDFTMPITNNITVTAKWTKNAPDPLTTYLVEFVENGGSPVGDQTVIAGEKAIVPDVPTRADYKFIGWYSDEGLTEEFNFATPITRDITLYAKWKCEVEYTVTFETNRGVPQIEPQIVGKNEYAKAPVDPQLGGKRFAGWYTDNGSWTDNWVFNKNKVTEDVTLYARWIDLDDETVTHMVEFDAQGGEPTPETQYVADGEYATEPTGDQVPTKEGYVFKGWWQDANNAFAWGPITNDEYPFAKWTRVTDPDNPPETVVVTYDSNGGSKVGAQVVEKGKVTPKPTDPVKVGYKFLGWFKDDGTEFDFHTVINENMTLTAQWKEIDDGGTDTKYYTVKFDTQGGSSVESQKVKEGQCAVEPVPAPTNQSMVFVGWFYDQGCTEEYVFSTPVTADLTLYASWKSKEEAENITHKVWFDGNGGTPSAQSQDVKNGGYVDASLVETPTKEGYTFSGWWLNDTDAFAWEKVITQETHVKAHWTKVDPDRPDGHTTYVVTYHSNGGTEIGPQTIVEGATAPKPTDPTKIGYTFVGWYTEEALTTAYNFSKAVNSNIDLYAKWKANSSRDQFTVNFDTKGGSSIDSQQVYYGDTATRPSNPTKEGYVFAGWFSDMDCTTSFDFSTPIVKPTTIYAKWDTEGSSDTEFNVTFKAEGGTFDDGSFVKVVTVKNGETVSEFDAPTKEGYTFGGWWIDDNNAYDFNLPVNNEMTVKAHWIKGSNITTYTVEFITNGGSSVGSQVIEKGKTAKRPDDPTQEGYNFKGWYSNEELTKTFNFSMPINADTKVYAKWEEKVMFKVTFETNNGTPTFAAQDVEQGKLVKEVAEPTRAGKIFAGWYTDNDVWKQAWNFSTSKVTGDMTLYARWIDLDNDSVSFKVTFDTQGGSPKPAAQSVKAGEYAKEPTAPKLKGYTFSGWWKNDDTAFAWGPIHSDETAVAHWISGENKQTVNVFFDYNGGGNDRVAVIEKGTYVPQPSIEPTKAGHNFVGWFTDEGAQYTFDDVVNADLNLTAKFEEIADSAANFYTVTFNSNGGSDVDSQKVKEGKFASEPVPVPTKDGLVFCGWYIDEGLTEPYFFANPVTKDITLYASWKTQSEAEATYHKIYFDGNGGTPNLQTIQVQNGKVADVTSVQTPTREGYTFLGWWYDDNNAYDSSSAVYQPAYIKAHWKKGTIETATVTFYTNGGTAVSTQTIVKGEPAKEPTAPTLDGYKFNGWYTKNGQSGSLSSEETQTSGTSSLFSIALAFADGDWGQRWNFADPVNGNLELYAKWDLAEYTVSFDTDGGSQVPDQLITNGSCATQPSDPTRAGYTFGGWYADANRTVPFNFNDPITGKTTIYARWIEGANVKTYKVTFDTLGGSQISSQIVKEGECAIEPDEPTRSGYTFGGWTSEKGGNTPFSFDAPINCDTTVYARWYEGDAVLHTVKFDSRGGTPDYEMLVKDGECVAKPDVDPTREGYTFGGWFSDTNGKYPFNFKEPITSDVTIYAYWYTGEYKTWNVTFESNGGSTVADQIVRDGYAPIKPDNPTKDGASFVGWYKDAECNEAFDWTTDVITRDTTLYAKWQSTEDTKQADATTNGGNSSSDGTNPGGSASSGNISKTGDDLMFSPLTIALAVLCFISLFCCVMAFIVGRKRDRDQDDWDDYDDYNDYFHFGNDDEDESGTYYGGVMLAQIT